MTFPDQLYVKVNKVIKFIFAFRIPFHFPHLILSWNGNSVKIFILIPMNIKICNIVQHAANNLRKLKIFAKVFWLDERKKKTKKQCN